MNLKQRFNEVIAARSLARSTGRAYWDQIHRFYLFIGKPASQWTGPDVEQWLVHLHRQNYSRKSRHQSLCAHRASAVPMNLP